MNSLPELLIKEGWTEEKFSQLDDKTSSTLHSLCNTIKELESKIQQLQPYKITDRLPIGEGITFMAVGMRYIKTPQHTFLESDNIRLMKDDNNPKNNMAIKVMVDGEHVAFVSNDYLHAIRSVKDFETKEVKLIRNFAQSSKLKLIINKGENDIVKEKSSSTYLSIRSYPITFSEDGKCQIVGLKLNNNDNIQQTNNDSKEGNKDTKEENKRTNEGTNKRFSIKGIGGVKGL